MKYSIILPVRNGGEYIKVCVKSILSQTLQNFNLIILDNQSTDGTSEWLASLKNEKIIVYPADKPLSIEENWARIREVPKNEFITLIGHDDILFPGFLENIDRLINEYPSAGLYHTHFNFIDADGRKIRSCKPMSSYYSPENLLKAFLAQDVDSMGTGYVMRSKDYDIIGGISTKYPSLLFADFELWLKLAAKGGMAVSEKTDFAFRVHQSTTGLSKDEKLHRALSVYVDFLSVQKNKDEGFKKVVEQYSGEMLLFYCKGFSHRLLRTPLKKREGLTIKHFVWETKLLAEKLGVEHAFRPQDNLSIKAALLIDKLEITRQLFLFFKKLFPKPVLK